MCTAAIIPTSDASSFALASRFVLEGLAAGTFVYVACVEMLGVELAGHRPGGQTKAACVCIGVFVFVCVNAVSKRTAPVHQH
jgi:hypothetical protein